MAIEGQSPDLAMLAEKLTREEHGIGLREAQFAGICVSCQLPAFPRCYSAAGVREYAISGLCELCFDAECGDGEE